MYIIIIVPMKAILHIDYKGMPNMVQELYVEFSINIRYI
jgi:hypothetical protein